MMHLSLDLFGTLIKPNANYKNARLKVFQDTIKYRYGINKTLEECKDTIWRAEKLFDKLHEETEHQETVFSSIESLLNIFLIEEGINDPNLVKISHIDAIHNELDKIWFANPPELFDGCEVLLNNLARKGVTFNILSNTVLVRGVIIDKWLSAFDFYKNITFSLYSDIVGKCKPSYAVYDIVKDRAPQGAEIVHVGDNVFTDGACVNSGIKFLLVNNKETDQTTLKVITDFTTAKYA